jgi:hypothetical protein
MAFAVHGDRPGGAALPGSVQLGGQRADGRRGTPGSALLRGRVGHHRRRHEGTGRAVTPDGINTMVEALSGIAAIWRSADPMDKAEIYRQLVPKLTYEPGLRLTKAEASPDGSGTDVGPRGDTGQTPRELRLFGVIRLSQVAGLAAFSGPRHSPFRHQDPNHLTAGHSSICRRRRPLVEVRRVHRHPPGGPTLRRTRGRCRRRGGTR